MWDFERSYSAYKLVLTYAYKHHRLTSETEKNWHEDIAYAFPYTMPVFLNRWAVDRYRALACRKKNYWVAV
jgi:hypothetical protein